MKGYKTSKDYKHLIELLDKGYEVVCFCTYDINRNGIIVTDVCRARSQENGRYSISARGIEYGCYWPSMHAFDSFEEMCEHLKLDYIEPTEL